MSASDLVLIIGAVAVGLCSIIAAVGSVIAATRAGKIAVAVDTIPKEPPP